MDLDSSSDYDMDIDLYSNSDCDSDCECGSESDNMDRDGKHQEYLFNDEKHFGKVMDWLNANYQAQRLCDIKLSVQDKVFACHKVVLASFSPYFEAMFNGEFFESQKETIALNGVEAEAVKLLIEYAYTSQIHITQTNVESLLTTANMWQVLRVRTACVKYLMKAVNVSNCLGIHCIAEVNGCLELQKEALKHVLRHFARVCDQETFLQLPYSKLKELITFDELTVESEEIVFTAVMQWYKHKPEDRAQELCQILESVRFPQMTPQFLLDNVEKESVIKDCPKCCAFVEEAKRFHQLPKPQSQTKKRKKKKKSQIQSQRTKARSVDGIIIVTCGFGGIVLRKLEIQTLETKYLKQSVFSLANLESFVAGSSFMYVSGMDKSDCFKILKYDVEPRYSRELAPMNIPRRQLGLAILDGFLYAIGGLSGKVSSTVVERYDPKTNIWEILAPMEHPVANTSVVVCCGELYVSVRDEHRYDSNDFHFGREETDFNDYTLQCYDPKTNKWTTIMIDRYVAAVCTLNNMIYVIGGRDDDGELTTYCECYDPSKKDWRTLAPMEEELVDVGLAAANDKIYVFGMSDYGQKIWNVAHRYDVVKDKWEILKYPAEALYSKNFW